MSALFIYVIILNYIHITNNNVRTYIIKFVLTSYVTFQKEKKTITRDYKNNNYIILFYDVKL